MEQDFDSPTDSDEHIMNEDDCAEDGPAPDEDCVPEFEDAGDQYGIEYDH